MRKLKTYHAYCGSVRCEREFGFRQFRIVTVMRTPERRDNLVARLRTAAIESGVFLNASEDSLFTFTSPKTGCAPTFDLLLSEES